MFEADKRRIWKKDMESEEQINQEATGRDSRNRFRGEMSGRRRKGWGHQINAVVMRRPGVVRSEKQVLKIPSSDLC